MYMDKSWKNVTYVRPSRDVDERTANIINEMLDEIYTNKDGIQNDINSFLNNSTKITAIKRLKQHYKRYHKSRNYTLKHFKFAIDEYQNRLIIYNKIEMLKKRIEHWCDKNGHDHMGYQKTLKDNKTGEYTYRYSDWEYVDDHSSLMMNDRQWKPDRTTMIKYNALWKKYVS